MRGNRAGALGSRAGTRGGKRHRKGGCASEENRSGGMGRDLGTEGSVLVGAKFLRRKMHSKADEGLQQRPAKATGEPTGVNQCVKNKYRSFLHQDRSFHTKQNKKEDTYMLNKTVMEIIVHNTHDYLMHSNRKYFPKN